MLDEDVNREALIDIFDTNDDSEAMVVRGLLEASEIASQEFVRLDEIHLTQIVQLRSATADEAKIRHVEQVEFTLERRLRTAGAFGDGSEPAQVWRQPVDDQAGFGQRSSPEHQAPAGLNRHAGVS